MNNIKRMLDRSYKSPVTDQHHSIPEPIRMSTYWENDELKITNAGRAIAKRLGINIEGMFAENEDVS